MRRIALGTVQFGLDYGISNKNGKVPENEVREILRTAWDSGIRLLDTAAAYGNGEEVLGRTVEPGHRFDIVTKVPKIGERFQPGEIGPFIRRTFEESLQKLKRDSVYALMFHDAGDLISPPGADEAYETLSALKEEGRIRKIGVSAYTREQLEAIEKHFTFDLIQVPVNVLDQRLVRSGYLSHLYGKGVEIHTRSTFLQGLILMNPEELKPFFDPVKSVLREFHAEARRLGTSPLVLALSYPLQMDTIRRVVVGVVRTEELREILDGSKEFPTVDFSRFFIENNSILNPTLWERE